MMPGATPAESSQADYKQKYKVLKRKLKYLIYEQECFTEELRKAQRKLLKVSRDRSFLLDRLLQYEKDGDDSSDTDATATSDSDAEKDGETSKKKKSQPQQFSMFNEASAMLSGMANYAAMMPPQPTMPHHAFLGGGVPSFHLPVGIPHGPPPPYGGEPSKKKARPAKKTARPAKPKAGSLAHQPGDTKLKSPAQNAQEQMTREEIERHLDSRPARPSYMEIEKATMQIPLDIFSNENSNPDSDAAAEDDSDLVIDLPH